LLIDQADPGKRQRALEFAGINSRLNNESADAQVTLAWVLFQLNRNNEAEQALRNGIQLGTNLSPDSRYLVAKMLTGLIFVNRQEAKAMLDSMGS
jgi:hypothetical protein